MVWMQSALFPWLASIVAAGGGGAAVAFLLFRSLGAAWLDSRFAKSLESHRHAQNREIEALKYRINSLFDRTVKLHQKEFDVVPEAWMLLVEAQRQTQAFTSMVRSYPPFMIMDEQKIEEFLATTPFLESQKEKIRSSDPAEMLKRYQSVAHFYEKADWHKAWFECRMFVRKNGIFFYKDLSQRFAAVLDLLWDAADEHSSNIEMDLVPREREKLKSLNERCLPLMEGIEADIRKRLWSHQQLDTTFV